MVKLRESTPEKWGRSERGFTLIELLVTLALLLIVLTPAVNAIAATTRMWLETEALNERMGEANYVISCLGREIREATCPASTTAAVLAGSTGVEGQELSAYRFDESRSEWQKIVYRVRNNNLQRAMMTTAEPEDIINAAIPADNSDEWKTLLHGVINDPVFTRELAVRTVHIQLQVADLRNNSPARFQPFTVASTYYIRNTEPGSIHGEAVPDPEEPPDIATYRAEILLSSFLGQKYTTVSVTGTRSSSIKARIWPVNASDQSVTWTSAKPDLVKVEYDPADSLNATVSVVPTRNDFNGWEWYLGLWPKRVTVTCTPNGGGQPDTCIVQVRR